MLQVHVHWSWYSSAWHRICGVRGEGGACSGHWSKCEAIFFLWLEAEGEGVGWFSWSPEWYSSPPARGSQWRPETYWLTTHSNSAVGPILDNVQSLLTCMPIAIPCLLDVHTECEKWPKPVHLSSLYICPSRDIINTSGYIRILLTIIACYWMSTDPLKSALCFSLSHTLLDDLDGIAARRFKQGIAICVSPLCPCSKDVIECLLWLCITLLCSHSIWRSLWYCYWSVSGIIGRSGANPFIFVLPTMFNCSSYLKVTIICRYWSLIFLRICTSTQNLILVKI